jgi:hypothetical protein
MVADYFMATGISASRAPLTHVCGRRSRLRLR